MKVEVLSETRQRFMGKTYYLCGKYFQRKGVRLHREVWREAHVWRRAEPLLLRELPGGGDPQEKERCA